MQLHTWNRLVVLYQQQKWQKAHQPTSLWRLMRQMWQGKWCMGQIEKFWNIKFLWQMENSKMVQNSSSIIPKMTYSQASSKEWQQFWPKGDMTLKRRKHNVERNSQTAQRDPQSVAATGYYSMSQTSRMLIQFLRQMQKHGVSGFCFCWSFTVSWISLNSAGGMQRDAIGHFWLHQRNLTLKKMLFKL